MKITVGHLMIVAGVGAYLVMGPLGGFRRLDKAEETAKPAPLSVVEPVQLPPVNNFDEKLPAGEALPLLPVAAPVVQDPPKSEPPALEESQPAVVAPKPTRRKRKSPAVQAAAPKKVSKADLTGVYVALKLANGREVKGALVEQNADFYKIELPGLGAMSYPVRDVVSIAPAQ